MPCAAIPAASATIPLGGLMTNSGAATPAVDFAARVNPERAGAGHQRLFGFGGLMAAAVVLMHEVGRLPRNGGEQAE